MLRAAAPVLGGGGCKFPDIPHALERHAGRARIGEHAADQRRTPAGTAPRRCTIFGPDLTRRRWSGRRSVRDLAPAVFVLDRGYRVPTGLDRRPLGYPF